MIRNRRIRLGDAAADNIASSIWGNPAYAAQTGQGALVSNVAANLTAQGIDPSTATPAQILAVYNAGQGAVLAQLQAGNVNPVLPTAPPSPQAPFSVPVAATPVATVVTLPPATAILAGNPQGTPTQYDMGGPVSPGGLMSYQIAGIPAVYVGAAVLLGLLLFGGKGR
jgi:hypothetical protein